MAVRIPIVLVALGIALAGSLLKTPSGQSQTGAASVQSRLTLSHALPPMDGAHLKASVIEVAYGPGGSSAPHSHPCPILGYVMEGTLRMQVKGEPEVLYKAGESFYEAPDGVHLVSANASGAEAARFVAFFTCDREAPLSSAVPQPGR